MKERIGARAKKITQKRKSIQLAKEKNPAMFKARYKKAVNTKSNIPSNTVSFTSQLEKFTKMLLGPYSWKRPH